MNDGIGGLPWRCYGPRGRHVPSDDALAAGVDATRCIVCRQRIELLDSEWMAVLPA